MGSTTTIIFSEKFCAYISRTGLYKLLILLTVAFPFYLSKKYLSKMHFFSMEVCGRFLLYLHCLFWESIEHFVGALRRTSIFRVLPSCNIQLVFTSLLFFGHSNCLLISKMPKTAFSEIFSQYVEKFLCNSCNLNLQ